MVVVVVVGLVGLVLGRVGVVVVVVVCGGAVSPVVVVAAVVVVDDGRGFVLDEVDDTDDVAEELVAVTEPVVVCVGAAGTVDTTDVVSSTSRSIGSAWSGELSAPMPIQNKAATTAPTIAPSASRPCPFMWTRTRILYRVPPYGSSRTATPGTGITARQPFPHRMSDLARRRSRATR
ncbi:hypothetical protein F0L68_09380 [Solihabitans fulvus]|uniref:Uncharacterized protein n=1 Tax=Solihabitans fulvus TaxID=1892852 RepID=A0A5B2XJW7_9PSEU|nr:hypothetical protein [Solihabitans fulvus]KAA2263693.1 hypothetical protein F0L68_09380 [Solihabitans fulvus]